MSAVLDVEGRRGSEATPGTDGHRAHRRRAPSRTPRGWIESASIFVIAALLLCALGYWTTVDRHLVFADGESRLAHAFMAVWDRPRKLATIGFIWPPLQTLALLPFVVVKPLATSLAALPVFAALCGGLMLAVLNRTLTLMDLRWHWRYPLLVLFAANPLFLCYASNGMAEILYLMLLTLGLHYFVSWHLGGERSHRTLALSGVFMALGFMARYELGAWIAVMAVWILASHWRTRQRWADVEAPLLIFLAPVVYLTVIWSVISMQVIGGGPLAWFTNANNQPQGPAIVHPHAVSIAAHVLVLTARVSPVLWVVPAGLVVLAVLRRDLFTGWLAGLVGLGAAVTFVLVVARPSTGLLQPRYNIRSFPAMLIGAGWLLRSVAPGRVRSGAGVVIVAALIAAVPLAFVMEEHYPHQYNEAAWAAAVKSPFTSDGASLERTATQRTRSDTRLAHWINAHIHSDKSTLVDDAAFGEVILLSGRPDLFVSRTDHGDSAWLEILHHPWGRVRYMIAANPALGDYGGFVDKVEGYAHRAYDGAFPGSRVIFRTRTAAVLEVDRQEPISLLLSDSQAHAFTRHGATPRLATRAPR